MNPMLFSWVILTTLLFILFYFTAECHILPQSIKVGSFLFYFQLYMLAAGDCVYKGGVRQLLPYLKSLGLECPPYNNPADYGMLMGNLFFLCIAGITGNHLLKP